MIGERGKQRVALYFYHNNMFNLNVNSAIMFKKYCLVLSSHFSNFLVTFNFLCKSHLALTTSPALVRTREKLHASTDQSRTFVNCRLAYPQQNTRGTHYSNC